MSQRAAIKLRRRFKIKFRDVARIGRPVYPRSISADKAARRLRNLIEKQRAIQARKGRRNK